LRARKKKQSFPPNTRLINRRVPNRFPHFMFPAEYAAYQMLLLLSQKPAAVSRRIRGLSMIGMMPKMDMLVSRRIRGLSKSRRRSKCSTRCFPPNTRLINPASAAPVFLELFPAEYAAYQNVEKGGDIMAIVSRRIRGLSNHGAGATMNAEVSRRIRGLSMLDGGGKGRAVVSRRIRGLSRACRKATAESSVSRRIRGLSKPASRYRLMDPVSRRIRGLSNPKHRSFFHDRVSRRIRGLSSLRRVRGPLLSGFPPNTRLIKSGVVRDHSYKSFPPNTRLINEHRDDLLHQSEFPAEYAAYQSTEESKMACMAVSRRIRGLSRCKRATAMRASCFPPNTRLIKPRMRADCQTGGFPPNTRLIKLECCQRASRRMFPAEYAAYQVRRSVASCECGFPAEYAAYQENPPFHGLDLLFPAEYAAYQHRLIASRSRPLCFPPNTRLINTSTTSLRSKIRFPAEYAAYQRGCIFGGRVIAFPAEYAAYQSIEFLLRKNPHVSRRIRGLSTARVPLVIGGAWFPAEYAAYQKRSECRSKKHSVSRRIRGLSMYIGCTMIADVVSRRIRGLSNSP